MFYNPAAVLFLFLFFTTNFCSNPTIFQFHHNFYHKCLPQTTTTNHYHNWGVNIYYHTNFCSNPTIFQFYHKFYHTFLPHILPQILPQTTTTNHYHNWRVNIYYPHQFLFQSDNFSILPHMLPQFLPQTTTTISTDPPQCFLYLI